MGSIRFKDLGFTYPGSVPQFQGLNWEASLEAGETLVILGPSGCGKSTLLRLLAGLERPNQGSIWVDNDDVTLKLPHERRFAMVFQERALFPGTVAHNIDFPLRLRRISKDRRREKTRELLSLVGLIGYEHKAVTALSGGQRQRVELARALAAEPSLCLLDEPLGQLDLPLRRSLSREIRNWIKSTGLRGIYVTHDPGEATLIGDHLATMSGGIPTPPRPPHVVFSNPASLAEAALTGEINCVQAQVRDIDAGNCWIASGDKGLRLTEVYPPLVADELVTVAFRPRFLKVVEGATGLEATTSGTTLPHHTLSIESTVTAMTLRDGVRAVEMVSRNRNQPLLAYLESDVIPPPIGAEVVQDIPAHALLFFRMDGRALFPTGSRLPEAGNTNTPLPLFQSTDLSGEKL